MTDDVMTFAQVAALAGLSSRQVELYARRAKCRRAGSANIPIPDAEADGQLAWRVDTIQQWLDERT